jgi:Tfp pilus assembly protein PilV
MKCHLQNRENNRKNAAAFTLVDVMVSMGIFAIGFISLYTGISSGFQVVQVARENLRATQIMAEKMETMRLYSWEQVTGGSNIPPNFVENYYPAALSSNSHGISYFGSVVVTNTDFTESYAADVRMVIVTLRWTNFNIPRTRAMSTLVARNGMQNYIF